MRALLALLLSVTLLLPVTVLGQELSECDEGTAECLCLPDDYVPFAETDEELTELIDCNKHCFVLKESYQYDYDDITGYQVQCSIGGTVTTLAQEPLDPVEDAFNEIYYQDPALSVEIPGLEFTSAYQDLDTFVSNYLGEYIVAVYTWVLSAGALLAVIMLMIAGLQWMLARGDSGRISKAKDRIRNAVTGIILLMGAYTFAYLTEPSLTRFDPFTIGIIEQKLHESTSGAGEGLGSGGVADPGEVPGETGADCNEAIQNGLDSGACTMSETLGSPTGGAVSCNYHFSGEDYNWAQIDGLDYVAPWGNPVYAPFSGTITHFYDSGGNACGNAIQLTGSGGGVYICHMKDWGGTSNGQTVAKGDIIGHVGGRCCAGESPPSDWSAGSYCTYEGTACTSAGTEQDCDCQPWQQSGNTTGGHIHLTYISGGNMIACFDESNY